MENGTTPARTVKERGQTRPKFKKLSSEHRRRFFSGRAKSDVREALNATNLDATARAVFERILHHSRDGKTSWVNQTRIAAEIRRGVRTVQPAVKRLADAKLIEVIPRREIDPKFKYGKAYRFNWKLLWRCYELWSSHSGDFEAFAQSDEVLDLAREAESTCAARVTKSCLNSPSATSATCESMEAPEPDPEVPETMFQNAATSTAEQPAAEESPPPAPPATEAPTAKSTPRANSREDGTNPRASGTSKRAVAEEARADQQRERERRRAERDRRVLTGAKATQRAQELLNSISPRKQAPEERDENHILTELALPGVCKAASAPSSMVAGGVP